LLPLTLERSDDRVRPQRLVVSALAVAALVALLVPIMRSFEDMPRAEVTFTNATRWDVDVALVLDGGRSRLPLSTIGPQRAIDVEEIGVPRGDWVFELSSWGHSGRVTISHRQLDDANNRVEVPPALVRELEDADPPHSPFGS